MPGVLFAWLSRSDWNACKNNDTSKSGIYLAAVYAKADTIVVLGGQDSERAEEFATEESQQRFVEWLRTKTPTFNPNTIVERMWFGEAPHESDFSWAYNKQKEAVNQHSPASKTAKTQPSRYYLLTTGTRIMCAAWLLLANASRPGTLLLTYPYREGEENPVHPVKVEIPLQDTFESQVVQSAIDAIRGRDESPIDFVISQDDTDTLTKLANLPDPVMILGETGTGKTHLAQVIHGLSNRRKKPFIALSCGELTEASIQSKLFGHLEGSYTGASSDRKGAFVAAGGGTLFLDEIGEMPLSLQPFLLKAVEENKVTPVGSDTTVDTDARLIFATNRDLDSMVDEGLFRRDLRDRISGNPIRTLPLSEREFRDRDRMIDSFLEQRELAGLAGEDGWELSKKARALLHAYNWPGNIRQLRDVIRLVTFNSTTPTIQEEMVASAIGIRSVASNSHDPSTCKDLNASLQRFTLEAIEHALVKSGGNQTEAGRLLGLSSTTLSNRLNKAREALGIAEA